MMLIDDPGFGASLDEWKSFYRSLLELDPKDPSVLSAKQLARRSMEVARGEELVNRLLADVGADETVYFACPAEDVDGLALGVLVGLEQHVGEANVAFACLWTHLVSDLPYQDRPLAPISSRYQEPVAGPVDHLVFAQSDVTQIATLRSLMIEMTGTIQARRATVLIPAIDAAAREELLHDLGAADGRIRFITLDEPVADLVLGQDVVERRPKEPYLVRSRRRRLEAWRKYHPGRTDD